MKKVSYYYSLLLLALAGCQPQQTAFNYFYCWFIWRYTCTGR